jgi:hypothetical protein
MSALGSLVVSLALNYAEYTRGLDKSGQDALKFAQRQQQALDKAGRATDEFFDKTARRVAGAVAGYVGISKVIGELTSSIDDLGAVDDLAQKTGSAAENISKMQKVAKQFNGDMAAIDPMLIKLAKGMASVDSETNKTHKALKALGISSTDLSGKLRDPSEVMVEIAKRLQLYEDGASKASLVTDAMGKSAADQLPYLNDLAANIDKVTGASADSAARAAELQDRLGGVTLRVDELFQSVAINALPAMGDFVGALDDVTRSSLTLSANNSVSDWADDTAVGVARVVDVIKVIPSLLRAVGGSFEVFFADLKLLGAQSQTFGGGAAASLLRGENPWANLGKALDERNAILEQANKRYSDLWNTPANQMEQAVLSRISFRKTYKDGYARNASDVLAAYSGYPVEVQRAAMLELAGNSGFNVASPYTNPAAGRRTLNYLSGTEAKDKKLNINNSYVADVFGASIDDLNREGVFADEAARKHEVVQQHIADYKEAQAALNAYNEDWNKYLGGLEQSIESLTRENELYGLNATQIAEVNLQRAEENLALAERNGVSKDYLDRLAREVDLRKQILDKTGALEQKKAWTSIFESIESTAHDTFVSIFDSGKNAFDRLRDTLKNGLLDLLYQMTLKKWIFQLGAVVSGGGASSAASAATSALSASSSAGGFGSIGNLLGAGKSGFDMISGFQGTLQGSIESLGATIANGMGGFADTVGGFLGTYSAQISNVLPFAGAAIQLLSGDAKGAAFTAAGAAIGSFIPGIGTAIGGMIGSIVGSFFGKDKPKMYGAQASAIYSGGTVTGTASNYGRSLGGEAVTSMGALTKGFVETLGGYMKAFGIDSNVTAGGVFRKRTNVRGGMWGSIDGQSLFFGEKYGKKADMAKSFESFVNSVMGPMLVQGIQKSRLPDGIKALFDGMTDRTQVLNMINATVGLNKSQQQLASAFDITVNEAAKVADATGLAGDELVKFVNTLSASAMSFAKASEILLPAQGDLDAAIDDALGQDVAFPTTMEAFDTLLKNIDTGTSAGIQMFADLFQLRERFASFTKTIDSLQAGVDASIYAMSTPDQQLAIQRENMTRLFDELGMTVPGSVQELIDLGKSIDLTTAAGIDLASVFPTLVSAFVSVQQQTDSLIESLSALDTSSFRSLVDYTRAQRYIDNGISLSNLPSYDVGTSYVPSDGPAVIHAGERIFTSTQNADIVAAVQGMNNGEVVTELRKLTDVTQRQGVALIMVNQKMHKILDRMDNDGVILSETDREGTRTTLDVMITNTGAAEAVPVDTAP